MIEYFLELVSKSITNKIGCGMAFTWMVDILVPIEYNMKMSSHCDIKSYSKQKICPQNLHASFF